ncbi:MAG TPA: PEGA domain-containing protein [Gallionella sp.]|nr:PEGA domain-containing protein [Gallionella sp.]
MNLLSRHWMMLVVLMFTVSGCSSVSVDGLLGDENAAQDGATTTKSAESSGNAAQAKYAITVRINKYVDQRKAGNPRLLGRSETYIRGMPRHQVVIDQEVATAVTNNIKERFGAAGYQVLEGGAAVNATFDVSGVIKELSLNVLERDEINIVIETTVKDAVTGRTVWSGLVTEKNDRFAGVSGNNKSDVVDYLNEQLNVASGKAVDAITASLMAAQPELFNQTPSAKAPPGVTVYTAPAAVAPAPMPVQAAPVARPVYGVQPSAPAAAPAPFTSTTSGLLVLTTTPPRAKVYLDQVYYGLTPLRVEVDPGVHAISVKLEGYKMITDNVSLRKGGVTEMELNLER